jgi:hypothetical protein
MGDYERMSDDELEGVRAGMSDAERDAAKERDDRLFEQTVQSLAEAVTAGGKADPELIAGLLEELAPVEEAMRQREAEGRPLTAKQQAQWRQLKQLLAAARALAGG